MGSAISVHSQRKRLVRLATPLTGENALIPLAVEGEDAMSVGFRIGITAFSEQHHSLTTIDIVGKPVTLVIIQKDNSERYLNGYVSGLTALGRSHGGQRSTYRLVVQPWLHFLDKATACRIFQDLSVPEILKRVFEPLGGLARYHFDLRKSHASYRYVTQYNETHGNFIRRLLRLEGIGFIIDHANGSHTVRFFDAADALSTLAPDGVLALQSNTPAHDHLSAWSFQGELATGRFVQRSYNYKQPGAVLQGESAAPPPVQMVARASELEQYTYTETSCSAEGAYRGAANRMLQGIEGHQVATGEGNYRHLQPGCHFRIKQVPAGTWVYRDAEFTLTRVAFAASDSDDSMSFSAQFEAVPKGEFCLPQGDQPLIASLQTALVTGPAGEEIYTDPLGRIKVRFHWDRDGAAGENTTCWLRVMQPMAGPGFGAHFTPRINQEVVVAFENGNPDRPFVLGALYHQEHKPPYAAQNGTRTGLRSRSTQGGGESNCNELYFDDAAGKEEFFIQAERDINGVIKRNESRRIGNDQTIEIKHDKKENIGNNASQNIAKKLVIEAGESITLQVGNSTIELSGGKIVVKSGLVDIDGSSVQVN